MKRKHKNLWLMILGFFAGVCNGLFGAGGGIIAVEALKKQGLDQKQAQSTSIAVIFPLSVLSAILYFLNDNITLQPLYLIIPSGIIGAVIGTYLMKKFSQKIIKKIFCFFMIYAGVRMIFKG